MMCARVMYAHIIQCWYLVFDYNFKYLMFYCKYGWGKFMWAAHFSLSISAEFHNSNNWLCIHNK